MTKILHVVGAGHLERFLLHSRRWNRLALPVGVDGASLIAAAGRSALAGSVQGHLTGSVELHLSDGDIGVPFELPIHIGSGR
jgi:hypothetical protein